MNYTEYYIKNNLLNKELHWFQENLLLETIVGSQMYGVHNKDSDVDFLGIVMPSHQQLYPQQYGHILGFDSFPKWERSERKGDKHKVIINDKETEGEWISLVNFFYSAGIKGSPNLIEILFARRNLVTLGTNIGWMLRDNRRMFLSMRTFQSFRGYAYGQLQRIRNHHKTGKSDNPKRQYLMDQFGYDTKQSYHLLRLLDQLEQVLTTNDIDLMRNKDQCIACRNGKFGSFEYLEEYFNKKILALEELSIKTSLSTQPQTGALHNLLQQCIEEWYGSHEQMAKQKTEYVSASDVMEKLNSLEQLVIKQHEPKVRNWRGAVC